MQKSAIPFLITSLILLVLLNSCAVKTVQDFEKTAVSSKTFTAPYFLDKSIDYVYKSSISVFGRDFGGIFIAKKINDTTHRIVFTTEFGNKLFDFEISGNEFKVNFILEELDRKIILNMLKRDFMLLLKKEFVVEEQFEKGDITVFKSLENNRFNFLFVGKKTLKLEKLVHSTKSKEKISIEYLSGNNTLADKITIDHKNIKLRVELNYLKN